MAGRFERPLDAKEATRVKTNLLFLMDRQLWSR
jgi:hypothetical protein